MDYGVKDLLILLGILLFIILMLWDIGTSWCRGAFWVPGEALVLTGLIIQILGYIESQNINGSGKNGDLKSLVESQLSIDCARVTMCVFVGFLLPRMAAASTGTRWSNILALLISISTHISTEVYVIHNAKHVRPLQEERVSWFIGSGGVLLLSIIGLVILLGYVVIAGKFISEILSRRIANSLNEDESENDDDAQRRFEYKILRTWVVTRVCQPEYVIARSMFSAATGGIVTCCVVLFAVKVILLRSLVKSVPLFSLQCVFILIGWMFIFYRWWTSVIYFGELQESWHNSRHVFLAGVSRYFQLQEIIFGFTVYDVMGVKNSVVFHKLRKSKCYHKIKVYLKLVGMFVKVLVSGVLVAPWLAFYFTTAAMTIFMSMFFWALIALLCRNKCLLSLCKIESNKNTIVESDEEFRTYKTVLGSVVVYGEDAASLWSANKSTFNNIKRSMKRAFDAGNDCQALISLLGRDISQEMFADELKESVHRRPESEKISKYFPRVNEWPWRMTALSLVKMIVEVGYSTSLDDKASNNIVQEAMLAYKQARELMDFADCPENVHVNAESFSTSNMEAFLLRYKAERDFRDLKEMYRHWKLGRLVNRDDESVVEAVDKCTPKLFECSTCIKNLVKQSLYSRRLTKNSNDLCDSIRSATSKHFIVLIKKVKLGFACWEDVAPTYSLLLVSQLIMEKNENSRLESGELLAHLHDYLANVVNHSLSGLPDRVVESCNKWAASFEEEKISKAIGIAGKGWAVREEAEKLKESRYEL